MALPKKGSRTLVVGDDTYRWIGRIISKKLKKKDYFDQGPDELIIELAENPGEKIRAYFTQEKIYSEYKKVGKKLGNYSTFPPYVVRKTIVFAIKQGWNPRSNGGIRDLGCLDQKIDFLDLQHESDPVK